MLRLTIETAPEFLIAQIAGDAALQTDAVASLLLDYYDHNYGSGASRTFSFVVEAALLACGRSTDADLLCRAWKERANTLRSRALFSDAEDALARASEYAQRTRHLALHEAVIDFARAAIAYDRRALRIAADGLDTVAKAFAKIGDEAREASARTFRLYVDYVAQSYDTTLAGLEAELLLATDVCDIAKIKGGIGGCLMNLGDYAEAERYLREAREICQIHRLNVLGLYIARTTAQLVMRTTSIEEGLRAMEGVRTLFLEDDMPGEAVRCLVFAVETIIHVSGPAAREISPLCRVIYNEATRLDIPATAAEAAERLRIAALRHEVTKDMLTTVLREIDPAARYVAQHTN